MSSPRNVCVTACDGHTGFAIAELLLTNDDFKVDSVVGLSLHPQSSNAKELHKLGAKVVAHHPGRERDMIKVLKNTKCDTLCLIPPAESDKYNIVLELISAAKKADIPNVLFISSVGCDLADPKKQPGLHQFIELETQVLANKGDPDTALGHSPCVIRAGFYAENILLYAPQVIEEKVLPLPIGPNHKFAPVALGDIAQLAAFVLSGKGEHGFDDRHRGQLMVATGPMLAAGNELAEAASKALGVDIEFEDISEAEAKKVLKAQAKEHDDSEKQYLLEYYALVRAGKTNYISTTAFQYVTGQNPQELEEFFKVYASEFEGAKKEKKESNGETSAKKRKTRN